MKTGYWNGEPTAQYEGITYEVTAVPGTPLHWQNPVAGKRRQGLRITQDGNTWIVDNEHGDGYVKLNEGKGMWTSGHKSVSGPINIESIPDHQIKQVFNVFQYKLEEKAYDRWAEKAHPAEFARLLALRNTITKFQSNRSAQINPICNCPRKKYRKFCDGNCVDDHGNDIN